MKLCILSDSHDNRRLLDIAVDDAKKKGAECILHCGDVVAPTTLRVLQKYNLPVHVIFGNNSGDIFSTCKLAQETESVIHFHGRDAALTLANKNIFMVHFPHYARALATTGDWDLVCCGHDHCAEISKIDNIKGGQSLLINPGTVAGVGASPTYALGDLDKMTFEIFPVPVEASLAYNRAHVTTHI